MTILSNPFPMITLGFLFLVLLYLIILLYMYLKNKNKIIKHYKTSIQEQYNIKNPDEIKMIYENFYLTAGGWIYRRLSYRIVFKVKEKNMFVEIEGFFKLWIVRISSIRKSQIKEYKNKDILCEAEIKKQEMRKKTWYRNRKISYRFIIYYSGGRSLVFWVDSFKEQIDTKAMILGSIANKKFKSNITQHNTTNVKEIKTTSFMKQLVIGITIGIIVTSISSIIVASIPCILTFINVTLKDIGVTIDEPPSPIQIQDPPADPKEDPQPIQIQDPPADPKEDPQPKPLTLEQKNTIGQAYEKNEDYYSPKILSMIDDSIRNRVIKEWKDLKNRYSREDIKEALGENKYNLIINSIENE